MSTQFDAFRLQAPPAVQAQLFADVLTAIHEIKHELGYFYDEGYLDDTVMKNLDKIRQFIELIKQTAPDPNA